MSSKRLRFMPRRASVALVVALALLVPVLAPSEVIRLKDGSMLKGKLVRVDGDTLTIRLSVGAPVKVHRAQVESIAFSDSIATNPAKPAGAVGAAQAKPTGTSTVMVRFEDRKVSSRITINKKNDWDAKIRSNGIVVEFVVDGVIAYTAVDTVMDKTIYLGEEKKIKNDAELQDFEVHVASGRRRCKLVVRNVDPDTFGGSFDPAPVNTVLDFDDFTVEPGAIMRFDIKFDKGFLKTASPRLYHANKDD